MLPREGRAEGEEGEIEEGEIEGGPPQQAKRRPSSQIVLDGGVSPHDNQTGVVATGSVSGVSHSEEDGPPQSMFPIPPPPPPPPPASIDRRLKLASRRVKGIEGFVDHKPRPRRPDVDMTLDVHRRYSQRREAPLLPARPWDRDSPIERHRTLREFSPDPRRPIPEEHLRDRNLPPFSDHYHPHPHPPPLRRPRPPPSPNFYAPGIPPRRGELSPPRREILSPIRRGELASPMRGELSPPRRVEIPSPRRGELSPPRKIGEQSQQSPLPHSSHAEIEEKVSPKSVSQSSSHSSENRSSSSDKNQFYGTNKEIGEVSQRSLPKSDSSNSLQRRLPPHSHFHQTPYHHRFAHYHHYAHPHYHHPPPRGGYRAYPGQRFQEHDLSEFNEFDKRRFSLRGGRYNIHPYEYYREGRNERERVREMADRRRARYPYELDRVDELVHQIKMLTNFVSQEDAKKDLRGVCDRLVQAITKMEQLEPMLLKRYGAQRVQDVPNFAFISRRIFSGLKTLVSLVDFDDQPGSFSLVSHTLHQAAEVKHKLLNATDQKEFEDLFSKCIAAASRQQHHSGSDSDGGSSSVSKKKPPEESSISKQQQQQVEGGDKMDEDEVVGMIADSNREGGEGDEGMQEGGEVKEGGSMQTQEQEQEEEMVLPKGFGLNRSEKDKDKDKDKDGSVTAPQTTVKKERIQIKWIPQKVRRPGEDYIQGSTHQRLGQRLLHKPLSNKFFNKDEDLIEEHLEEPAEQDDDQIPLPNPKIPKFSREDRPRWHDNYIDNRYSPTRDARDYEHTPPHKYSAYYRYDRTDRYYTHDMPCEEPVTPESSADQQRPLGLSPRSMDDKEDKEEEDIVLVMPPESPVTSPLQSCSGQFDELDNGIRYLMYDGQNIKKRISVVVQLEGVVMDMCGVLHASDTLNLRLEEDGDQPAQLSEELLVFNKKMFKLRPGVRESLAQWKKLNIQICFHTSLENAQQILECFSISQDYYQYRFLGGNQEEVEELVLECGDVIWVGYSKPRWLLISDNIQFLRIMGYSYFPQAQNLNQKFSQRNKSFYELKADENRQSNAMLDLTNCLRKTQHISVFQPQFSISQCLKVIKERVLKGIVLIVVVSMQKLKQRFEQIGQELGAQIVDDSLLQKATHILTIDGQLSGFQQGQGVSVVDGSWLLCSEARMMRADEELFKVK